MEVNNREIAFLIWGVIAFALMCWKVQPGKALLGTFRPLVSRAMLAVIALMIVYIAACVWILEKIGLWSWINSKTTLLWVFGFAFVTLFDVNRISEDSTFFRKTLRDTLSVTVVVVFIAEFHSFSLPTELVLAPALLVLTLMTAVSGGDSQLAPVESLAATLLVVAGIALLGNSAYRIYGDFTGFATLHTMREFASPIVLSILFLPFIFLVNVYVTYENAFLRLRYSIKDEELRRYAQRSAVIGFGFELKGLRKWLRHVSLFQLDSRGSVTDSIREIRTVRRRERRPYRVPPLVGWPPDRARSFLNSYALTTRDYHRSYDGWRTNSSYLKLGKSILDNNIAYYLEGDEFAVNRLTLILNINEPSDLDAAEHRFAEIASALVNRAVFQRGPAETFVLEANGQPIVVRGHSIDLAREDWVRGVVGGYELVLTICAESSKSA